MIHTVVQITRRCSVALCADYGTDLPDNDVIIKGMARAVLPNGEWDFEEIEWDSSRAVVVWYNQEDESP